MKLLVTAVAFFIAGFANAQTKTYNDPDAKVRTLSGSFSKISVSSGIELYLTQASENALAVSVSDAQLEERFKTDIVDGTLRIYFDHKNYKWKNGKNRKLKAYVSYKTLDGLTCSSGSSTTLTNTLNTGNLALSFSSGCVFEGEIKATDVTSTSSSGSSAKIWGKAEKLTVTATSGSEFKGAGLVTAYCTASVNSGANIKIDVQKELNASANSGGEIKYSGAATLNKGTVNSGGSVKHSSK
ncbi:MAG: DUF2807 domain-containing protein [Sphingobacteriales bacterium]|nr:MAG: DUF2807 domain-containing protein [Sphingobacteriales bacterium]